MKTIYLTNLTQNCPQFYAIKPTTRRTSKGFDEMSFSKILIRLEPFQEDKRAEVEEDFEKQYAVANEIARNRLLISDKPGAFKARKLAKIVEANAAEQARKNVPDGIISSGALETKAIEPDSQQGVVSLNIAKGEGAVVRK